ncbi:condensation domain-containing protein, partial [Herbidospora cretacea]|uniref:condensation domain-containing protein n=1 Tax=Herbidospora cretacea TaxID=28444 RepID=UPI000556A6D0
RVVGPFINTLPVRVRSGRAGIRQAVEGMRAQLAGLLEHEHAPLALAQRAAGLEGNTPLFTSLLNYRFAGQGGERDERQPEVPGIRNVLTRVQNSYPLTVSVNDRGAEGLSLSVLAAAGIDGEAVGSLMRTATTNVTEALSTSPDLALRAVDVLGEEVRALLGSWNDTASGGMAEPVLRLFERQVALRPDAVAVVADGRELTYRQLDESARRVAAKVGDAPVVGLRLPRGADMSPAGLVGARHPVCTASAAGDRPGQHGGVHQPGHRRHVAHPG